MVTSPSGFSSRVKLMIAPFGGLSPAPAALPYGASAYRQRTAGRGAKRCSGAAAISGEISRTGVRSSRIHAERPRVPTTRSSPATDEVDHRDGRHVEAQRLP